MRTTCNLCTSAARGRPESQRSRRPGAPVRQEPLPSDAGAVTDVVVIADDERSHHVHQPVGRSRCSATQPSSSWTRCGTSSTPTTAKSPATCRLEARSNPGELVRGEARHQHADGRWVSMDVIVVNLLHDPVVQGVLTNFRDVTDKSRAARTPPGERRQVPSPRREPQLMRSRWCPRRVCSRSSASRSHGCSATPPRSWSERDVRTLVHPDDLERRPRSPRSSPPIPASRWSTRCEARHADGSWRWIEATEHEPPRDAERARHRLQLPRRDRAARRAGAARGQRGTLPHAGAARVRRRADHGRRRSHHVGEPRGEADARLRPRGAGRPPRFSDLCHPDDYDAVYRAVRAVARGRRNESMRTESRTRHKDGTYIWVDSIVTNHLADPGLRGIVANFRDITLAQGGRARAAGQRGSLAIGGRRFADRHLRARRHSGPRASSTNAGKRSPAWPTRRRSAARGSRSSIPTTARRWRSSGRRRARRASPSAGCCASCDLTARCAG